MVSRNLTEWALQFEKNGNVHPEDCISFRKFFSSAMKSGQVFYYRRKVNADWRWVYLEILKQNENSLLLFIRDINDQFAERLSRQNQLEYESNHDVLTGLNNRNAYQRLCDNFPAAQNVGIIYADLNKLKKYNDQFGHDAGDNYIRSFSKLLCASFREEQIYRIGGDQFVIIAIGVPQEVFMQHIFDLFSSMMQTEISCSIGKDWESEVNKYNLHNYICKAQAQMYLHKKTRIEI